MTDLEQAAREACRYTWEREFSGKNLDAYVEIHWKEHLAGTQRASAPFLATISRLTEERERTERNCEMWRRQCERQANRLTSMRAERDAVVAAFEAKEKADCVLEKDGGLQLDIEAARLWTAARKLLATTRVTDAAGGPEDGDYAEGCHPDQHNDCACMQPGGDPLGNCEICDPPTGADSDAERARG